MIRIVNVTPPGAIINNQLTTIADTTSRYEYYYSKYNHIFL